MAVNFLDPNQVNEFRTFAKQKGMSDGDLEIYVRKRQAQEAASAAAQSKTLDLQSKQLDIAKKQQDIMGMGEGKPLSDRTEFEKKTVNALKAADDALSIIQEEGKVTGQLTSRLASVGEFFGKTGRATDYKSALNLASSQLFNALAGATQSPQELKRLERLLPGENESEATATRKLENLVSLLTDQAGMYGIDVAELTQSQPAAGVAKTAPAINLMGEIAKEGDLIKDEQTGDVVLFGETPTTSNVFKTMRDGGDVSNSLVKWLADSEFLPIAGSVIGGVLGSGLASVGTAAIGAGLGKTMQQGLREIIDPERQELSDIGKAVIVEGVTDAILGGAMFGIGVTAKGALKFVAGKSSKEVAGEVVKQTAKKTAKKGVEESIEKTTRDLVARGLNPSKKQMGSYSRGFGTDLVDDLMSRYGIPKSGEALKEAGEKNLKQSSARLSKILSGKSAKTADVIKDLQEIQYKVLTPSGSVLPNFEAGVSKIDDYIKSVAGFGDEIPLTELNKIKQGLQESFAGSLDVTTGAKEIVQTAAKTMREFVEEFDPRIAGTNKAKMLDYLAIELGEDLTQKKAKALFQFSDLVVGASNPLLLVGKKGVDLFSNVFEDPLTQARILDKGLKIAASNGNKQGVRNILRFMTMLKSSFEAAPRAFRSAVAGAGAEEAASAIEPSGVDGLVSPQPQGVGLDEMVSTPLYK